MNSFSSLYEPNIKGAWLSAHQGLSTGMDLLDWLQFIARACMVIESDPDLTRRLNKAQRLQIKARKVRESHWIAPAAPARIQAIITQTNYEINEFLAIKEVQ